MPVWLESLEINEENVSGNIDYLKGNMFQKIEVNIEIRVETWVEMNTTDEVYFGDPGMTTTDWITATWPFATDFNVGDSLAVVGSNSNDSNLYLITEKPSDYEIRPARDLVYRESGGLAAVEPSLYESAVQRGSAGEGARGLLHVRQRRSKAHHFCSVAGLRSFKNERL